MIIKVCGTTNEGKTALANFIEQQLAIAGINATVIDDGEEQYLSTEDLAKKMHAIYEKGVEVEIQTVQVAKEAMVRDYKR